MKKSRWIRISLYIFFGLVSLFLLAAILVPYFFKDDIKAAIDEQIAQSVNADVNFELDDFRISLFRNFPNISVGLGDLSVVGKDEFAGDTLTSIQDFRLVLDIWSVLFGSEMKVRGVYVDSPRIYAKVLSNGKANWDIVIAEPEDTTQKEEEEKAPAEFNVDIRRWEINHAFIVYEDASLNTLLKLDDLTHSGSGNLNQDEFDLRTQTKLANLFLNSEGITYLENKKLDVKMDLNMNLPESKYTFMDNRIQINEFSFGFDGFVQLAGDSIQMDVTYAAKENEFKNILSLVPGVFTEDFDQLKTSGKLAFDGAVKGIYYAEQLPAFNLNLQVSEGMFQYPDLPTAVNNVQTDLTIENKDGVIDHTLIEIKQFHMDLGKNPIDAKARIENLTRSKIDAKVLAKLNLADLIQMFPMPGLTLRGNFDLDLNAKGIYDAVSHQLPSVNANMSLQNGYVKTDQYPDALEQVQFLTKVNNSTGQYADTKIHLETFKMVLDGEPFEADAYVENLDDPLYEMNVQGGINLEKIMHIYPLEDTELSGKIFADIHTKGQMSDVEAGRYDQLPTTGTTRITNLNYKSPDLPQGFKITEAQSSFTPQGINLEKMNGFLGKSDISLTGNLNNYIAYLFTENGVLVGKMDFKSNRFDTNEWLEEEESGSSSTTTQPTSSGGSSSASAATEIPKNIDFTLDSYIKEVIYGKFKLNDLKGNIIIRDGKLNLNQVTFDALGGSFLSNAAYDPTNLEKPKYSFDFGIKELPLNRTYQELIAGGQKSLVAQTVRGDLFSQLKISGELGKDLMPLFNESMNGLFSATVADGMIGNLPVLGQISNLTGLGSLDQLTFNNTNIKAQIKDGRVTYQPFDVRLGGYNVNIKGSNGVDGSLDFNLRMEIPSQKLGALTRTVGRLAGLNLDQKQGDNIILPIKIGGTYKDPKLSLTNGQGETIKDVVKDKVAEVKDKAVDKVKETLGEDVGNAVDTDKEEAATEIIRNANEQAAKLRREASQRAQQIREEADAQEKKAIEEGAKKGLIAKKAAEVAARKVKQAAYKKAEQIEQEADKQAEQIIKEAEEQAEKLRN